MIKDESEYSLFNQNPIIKNLDDSEKSDFDHNLALTLPEIKLVTP